MRIVIDANMPLGKDFFSTVGEVIAVPPRDIAREHLVDADALVVRSVKTITGAMLANTPVKFVGTCTAGFDHLQTEAIEHLGIHWCNAPGSNANSVVEYVFCALSALNLNWLSATVGIVGCGQVGGLLHRRLRALNVTCQCYDPFLTQDSNPNLSKFNAILDCDIICLHTPYTVSGPYPTHHLFNTERLGQLKPDTLLINAGRGGVVDNQALLTLLQNRADLSCVLDVWEHEPKVDEQLVNTVAMATPHIAGHSMDGKMKGTAMVYQQLCDFFKLTPTVQLRELDKDPELPEITITTENLLEAIQQATVKAYDVGKDSAAWKADIAAKKNIAGSFDQYRKNYPARREFFHRTVNVESANPKIGAALSVLGFNIFNKD